MSKVLKQALEAQATDDFMTRPFVFLGGTVNGSTWRDQLTPMLEVAYYNPVVENWTPDDERREHQARALAKVMLFVITPKQKGFYSLVEMALAVAEASKRHAVIVCFLDEDGGEAWQEHQVASNRAIQEMLAAYPNVFCINDLQQIARDLNTMLGHTDE